MEGNKRYQIPAFGHWNYDDDFPITQYFESVREAGIFHYTTTYGGLYGSEFQKPTYIATVPRHKAKRLSKRYEHGIKDQKKQDRRVYDVTDPPRSPRAPKVVDEDLYKIPSEFLHKANRRKKMLGFLSRCLVVDCIM